MVATKLKGEIDKIIKRIDNIMDKVDRLDSAIIEDSRKNYKL